MEITLSPCVRSTRKITQTQPQTKLSFHILSKTISHSMCEARRSDGSCSLRFPYLFPRPREKLDKSKNSHVLSKFSKSILTEYTHQCCHIQPYTVYSFVHYIAWNKSRKLIIVITWTYILMIFISSNTTLRIVEIYFIPFSRCRAVQKIHILD